MSDSTLRRRAEARLEEALERVGIRDPRVPYRDWLRAIRARDREAFDEASRYYEERVLPRLAEADSDPIAEWLAYGVELAGWSGPGRLVEIDAGGRAHSSSDPPRTDRLLLYLPESPRESARVLNLPVRLSAAQRATHDLLIEGRVAPSV